MAPSACCLILLLFSIADAQKPVSVRFVGSSAVNYGILEVTLDNGNVGRICDLGFDNSASSAVCAMLGFRDVTGFKLTSLPAVTTGIQTAVMAVTGCSGFLATSPSTWKLEICDVVTSGIPAACNARSRDAGVICTGTLTTAPGVFTTITPNLATVAPTNCSNSVTNIRLIPGPNEGLVVIQNPTTGANGTICADTFGVNEAVTVCRMLCQNATTSAIGITGKYLDVSSGYPVMLSGLTCGAGDFSINSCSKSGWGAPSAGCNSITAVTVRCTPIDLTPPAPPQPWVICSGFNAFVYFPTSSVSNASLLSLHGSYNPSTCNFSKGENSSLVWAVIPYTGCNSELSNNETHIIYRSNLYRNVTAVNGVLKDTPYVIPVVCAIAKVNNVSATLSPDTRTIAPITGGDSYGGSEVRLFQGYTSGAFQSEITVGQRLIVGSKIFARVQLLTSPLSLQLTVRNCWASEKSDGTGTTYHIVQRKCASTDNSIFRVDARTVGINFVVVSFAGSASTQVYVFCDVIVCSTTDTDSRCQQVCGTTVRRKRRAVEGDTRGGVDRQPHNGPFQIILRVASAADKLVGSAVTTIALIAAFISVRCAM